MTGVMNLPKMAGVEIKPGVILLAEPTAILGTNKLQCLANVCGVLALIELKITFQDDSGA